MSDYAPVHTGYSISVIDQAKALERLCLLQELDESHPVEESLQSAMV